MQQWFCITCSSSSEDECTIIDDDDDSTVSRNVRGTKQNLSTLGNAKRSRLEITSRSSQSSSGTSRSSRKMGVNFGGDSSEEDEFDRSVPQRKRMR